MLTRYVRSAVLDVLREDYLRTARAKGLARCGRWCATGCATPRAGRDGAGLQLATLLIGAVVIERVFVIPGSAACCWTASRNRDLLVVQDVVMLLVLAVLR